jgi:arginine deiminase
VPQVCAAARTGTNARPQRAGLGITGRIENEKGKEEAYLEGGDFFPAGEDLALLGIGLRTNYAAARQLMDKDLLGTSRFAVVRDELDQNQDRMHLDCVFSILTDDCCLMLETMLGEGSPQKRLVDLWTRAGARKPYTLAKEHTGIEFGKFMTVRCIMHIAAGAAGTSLRLILRRDR